MASAALAVFAKESGAAIVAIVPLYDLLLRPSVAMKRDALAGWVLPAIPLAAFAALRQVAISPAIVPVPFVDNPMVGAGFWQARLTALAIIGEYVAKIAWPVHLSADYSFPQIPMAMAYGVTWRPPLVKNSR